MSAELVVLAVCMVLAAAIFTVLGAADALVSRVLARRRHTPEPPGLDSSQPPE